MCIVSLALWIARTFYENQFPFVMNSTICPCPLQKVHVEKCSLTFRISTYQSKQLLSDHWPKPFERHYCWLRWKEDYVLEPLTRSHQMTSLYVQSEQFGTVLIYLGIEFAVIFDEGKSSNCTEALGFSSCVMLNESLQRMKWSNEQIAFDWVLIKFQCDTTANRYSQWLLHFLRRRAEILWKLCNRFGWSICATLDDLVWWRMDLCPVYGAQNPGQRVFLFGVNGRFPSSLFHRCQCVTLAQLTTIGSYWFSFSTFEIGKWTNEMVTQISDTQEMTWRRICPPAFASTTRLPITDERIDTADGRFGQTVHGIGVRPPIIQCGHTEVIANRLVAVRAVLGFDPFGISNVGWKYLVDQATSALLAVCSWLAELLRNIWSNETFFFIV